MNIEPLIAIALTCRLAFVVGSCRSVIGGAGKLIRIRRQASDAEG